ncbi:MAG: OmpA family protein [Bacteroidota bacterium]
MKVTLLLLSAILFWPPFHVDLKASVLIKGQVRASDTHEPISSHISILADEPNPVQLMSLPNGGFEAVLPNTSPFTLRVEAKGFDVFEKKYDLQTKKDTTLFIDVVMNPVFAVTFSGEILDAQTGAPIAAEFDLYLNSDIVKEDVQVVQHGHYNEVLTKEGWYIIEVTSPGYLTVTDTVWFMNEKRKSIQRNYLLTKLEVGLNMVIPNVVFYFGKTLLKPESAAPLTNVLTLLNQNPGLKLEIGGHTDDEGDANYNLQLSQGRAQSVVDYLIKQGIDSSRLRARGYGEEQPIDNTGTKAGKAKNRRVAFTVLAQE